jgi:hypothetical protein
VKYGACFSGTRSLRNHMKAFHCNEV